MIPGTNGRILKRLPGSPKGTSFVDRVDDLHEILGHHFAVPQAVLIGHSCGGELAAHFAARYPGMVDRLVLSPPEALPPEQFDDDGTWANPAKYPVPEGLHFSNVAGTFV